MPQQKTSLESNIGGPSFLAIDDSDVSLELIRRTLKRFGFTNLTTLKDPLLAIEALSNGKLLPDLILLDYLMPQMNGIEICARIRVIEATIDTPIIMLTNHGSLDTLSNAFIAGANDYITKPFEVIEFEARIRSCLRLKSELDRRKAYEVQLSANSPAILQRKFSDEIDVPPLLLSSSSLYMSVSTIPSSRWPDLAILAMRLASPCRSDQAILADNLVMTLASIDVPANSLLGPIDPNIFCCIIPTFNRGTIEEIEERFRIAVHDRHFFDPLDPIRRPLELVTSVSYPGTQFTIGEALADAINAIQSSM